MANEKRLIDANALKDALRTTEGAKALGNSVYKLFCVDEIIDAQPTVDAVKVVRCKDCIWFDLEDELPDVFRSEQYCYCTEANTYVPINHFCSFGERRTDAR